MNYIPKNDYKLEKKILFGDILVFIQKDKNIDASHVGFIIKKNNQLYFRNATSLRPKTVIDSNFKNIIDYIKTSSKHLGVSILRLNTIVNK